MSILGAALTHPTEREYRFATLQPEAAGPGSAGGTRTQGLRPLFSPQAFAVRGMPVCGGG